MTAPPPPAPGPSNYCDVAPGHPFHGPYHDSERESCPVYSRVLALEPPWAVKK